MYWTPAIFIFFEIFFLSYVDKLVKLSYCNSLYSKYKDESLKEYIDSKFEKNEIYTGIVGLFLLAEIIYFIVGLFYPIWIFSSVYILQILISAFLDKPSIEKQIRFADLNGFESKDPKFSRLLKLNQLEESTKEKTFKDKIYRKFGSTYFKIFPIIKIIVFAAIIILHYNYKLI